MLKSGARCRLPSFWTAVVGLTLVSVVACTEGPPAPSTPIVSGPPTAVIIQGTASTTGLTVEDRCITANAATRQGPGRITGGGLDMQLTLDSIQTFSEVIVLVADTVCRGGATRSDVERLVQSVNQKAGLAVVQYTWSGA